MITRSCRLLVIACFLGSLLMGAEWWQLTTWNCNPSSCTDSEVGLGRLTMTTNGICGGGFLVGAASSVVSGCNNGLIDVSGYTAWHQTRVLTELGWVDRWVDGVGADAHGQSGAYRWQMIDEHFCDDYRRTYTQPDIPCG
jgi:hypothetical protein